MGKKITKYDKLLKAAAEYIEELGGRAIVIGGVEVHSFPGEELKFKLAVRVMGRKPNAAMLKARQERDNGI